MCSVLCEGRQGADWEAPGKGLFQCVFVIHLIGNKLIYFLDLDNFQFLKKTIILNVIIVIIKIRMRSLNLQ